MSAAPPKPSTSIESAARECARQLVSLGFTPEECAVLAFVKGASWGVRHATEVMDPAQQRVAAMLNEGAPSWPSM